MVDGFGVLVSLSVVNKLSLLQIGYGDTRTVWTGTLMCCAESAAFYTKRNTRNKCASLSATAYRHAFPCKLPLTSSLCQITVNSLTESSKWTFKCRKIDFTMQLLKWWIIFKPCFVLSVCSSLRMFLAFPHFQMLRTTDFHPAKGLQTGIHSEEL